MTFNVFDSQYSWLIDTGASLSVVKHEILERRNIPFHKNQILIKGIGGDVYSEGFIYLNLNHNGQEIEHKFYVLRNFPCRTDGILGQDFLSLNQCILRGLRNLKC